MTKHAAFAAEDAVTAVPPPAQASRLFSSFPPRMASDCKKAAQLGRMDLAVSGVLRAGSLVDSMKASSPRYSKFAASGDHEDWMEKHPSALEWFEAVQAAAKGKQIVMFLDYDGTLSPIVEDPESAVMTEDMRDAVRRVSQNFPTAIVSGRGRDKVFNFVKLEELYYAGSHGMDIKGPTTVSNHKMADEVLCQPATEFLPVIQEVYEMLTAKMESIPGAMVENNKFCLSVHFRCVDEKEWDGLSAEVRAVLEGYPDLCLTKGRKVLEIRPSIKWDKGNALEFLLESLGYAGRGDVFPIYIGDDRTDEDAFKVLRDMGQGIGVLVTKFPKETTASYSLREPAEVKDFLRKLVKSSVTKG
ncbi:hypothetical protein QYE76_017644 [Lolium multiflorum]|uniref:Trehalose 6-phosphate phosphatase n=1 Tax=Lolium multiflorum TaxID=4521 RepID=A0AAD8V0S4_LOLMU|nr:hypothetical protein QYE76_017644 [Lolium multiflorum]